MEKYDLIVIGTGSAMNIVGPLLEQKPDIRIAVIDKDEPGGICLTRGCIPSKIILYPAEIVRIIDEARALGIQTEIKKIDFKFIMDRMRSLIGKDIDDIRKGLSNSKNIDYYPHPAEFTAPYTLVVNNTEITAPMIFLCTGSQIMIPQVKGIDKVPYLTSDTVLQLNELPKSVVIIGGGYIGAEYGHFFSSMGSQVTIIGRNPQFLPDEEPEISIVVRKKLGEHVRIITNHEVNEIRQVSKDLKEVICTDRKFGKTVGLKAEQIMIATGRVSLANILHTDRAGIKLSETGWIHTDEYLETSQKNVWAFGDANGKYMFKHKANYESALVYYNAILRREVPVDYHALPHAVFTYPEIAAVGLKQSEAVQKYGSNKVAIGFYEYEGTAKGEAMNVKDYFVKVIVEQSSSKILGAHIVGPQASVLIHEIIPLMNTIDGSYKPIMDMMHIHPALSEVVARAFENLMPAEHYDMHIKSQLLTTTANPSK